MYKSYQELLFCNFQSLIDIILHPDLYNITGWKTIEKVADNVYIQSFGDKNELKLLYKIDYCPGTNEIVFRITNTMFDDGIEKIIFQYTSLDSESLNLRIDYEQVYQNKHKILNKFLKLVKADEDMLIDVCNRIKGYIEQKDI